MTDDTSTHLKQCASRPRTLAGQGDLLWGAAPPRHQDQVLFGGWGPRL
ncbi:MAG: hypothetical protein JO060_03145 [Candidatus Eremiobacteraeota bacterium]|nr:hypothetical protein [Candidatus Eremiobacteraeota bacterium]